VPTRSVFRSDPPSRPGPFPPRTPETQEDSGNAAANGNFSIQVLTKALEVWSLTCVPATSQAAGSAWREPQRESAFLCNLDQHWFTVRRCDARSPTVHASAAGTSTDATSTSTSTSAWWNFNSMFPAPQPISELYLSAFLAQLKDEGYSIFVVRGVAPRADANAAPGPTGEYGRWITPEEAATLNKQAETIKNAGRARNAAEQALARIGAGGSAVLRVAGNVAGSVFGAGAGDPRGGEEDAELQAAIAASLGTTGPGTGTGTGTGTSLGMTSGTISGTSLGTGSASDDDLARALAASLAGAAPPAPPPRDDDLAAAIAASLADSVPSPSPSASPLSPFLVARGGLDGFGADAAAPSEVASVPEEPGPADPEALTLAFRAPGGSRLRRRFLRGDSVGAAAAYVAAATGTDMSRHRLTLAFPRRQLSDASATLHDAGVKDKETLSVEPARD
jgi:ataxin-3